MTKEHPTVQCQTQPRLRGELGSNRVIHSNELRFGQPCSKGSVSEFVGSGLVKFEVATPVDDFEIRRLLRESPMPGNVSISLEREPDYFTEARAFDLKSAKVAEDRAGSANVSSQGGAVGTQWHTIVARDTGRVVCVGSCTIRPRFVNGQPLRVGYLGGLRLDAAYAGRFDVLRRGYQLFADLQAEAPADFYFTSIAEDNARARRFLERGVVGMPRYEFVGGFVTLIIAAGRASGGAAVESAGPLGTLQPDGAETPAVAEQVLSFLNHRNSELQFAPAWSPEDLTALGQLGFRISDAYVLRNGGRIVATGALWDQRGFKQTVIRGYRPWLAFSRFALDGFARLANHPRLPPVGGVLASAFVSHLATAPEQQTALVEVLCRLRASASERQIQLLALGFATSDPRLATIRAKFRCREYYSRIYVVNWPGLGRSAAELDGRLLAPEVSLL
jgi:hypothetical protein